MTISMDNKKKGYNLRALFITLCPAQVESEPLSPAGIKALPHLVAAMPNVAVSVAALRPMLSWSEKSRATANNQETKPAHADPVNVTTHIIRWPVLALRSSQHIEKLWPGAGFAFPFVGDRLVNILHTLPFDIMIALDLQFAGYVAYRLREITGVPYVLVQGDSGELTQPRQSPARQAVLTAIARDAEFVLGHRSNAKAATLRYPGSRFRDFDHSDSSGDKFIVLLQEALRQSGESFDW